jgi:hypothetical protein
MASFLIRISIPIGVLVVGAASPSFADDRASGGGIARLVDAQLKERNSSGELMGCEVLYTVGYEDHISRDGGMVLLRGSLSINRAIQESNGPPHVILRAAALDFDGDTFEAAPMNYASLSAGGRSYAHQEVSSFRCEDEGMCAVYDADSGLAQAIGTSFAVSYNRARGGRDVTVPVDLSRTRPQLAAHFAACAQALISEQK